MNIPEAFAAARHLQQTGRWPEAEAQYRSILAQDPSRAEVHYNLGLVLRSAGRPDEAAAAYERAIQLQPNFPEAVCNLGAIRESVGQLEEAEDLYRHALLLRPEFAEAWNNLGGVYKDVGRPQEAIACFDRAVALQPDNARLGSNRLFALQYSPVPGAPVLAQAARNWNEHHAAALGAAVAPHGNDPAPGRRLRVGYVSGNFRTHCQAFFTIPLLTHHDHSQFDIVGYSSAAAADGVTRQLQACTDEWHDTAALDDAQLAEQIRRDRIDILVDLTLHMAGDRLLTFARRPAPVQVTWLGYPGTTGLPAIDYRLTDPWLDPPGVTDAFYAERSVRLPETFWCYDPLGDQPLVNPLPAASSDHVTFGCLNNFCKVNDGVLAAWAKVLQAVPESRLLLLAPPGAARRRVQARLGVAPDRLEFTTYQPRAQYLEQYHRIDLGLDTFPYNGHTTSLDALWMGVPVVSLAGSTVVSRAGLSLLSNLALADLAARTPEEFVRLAAGLARDRFRLAGLRAGLRARLAQSPLMDAVRFARHVEQAYRGMWRHWCQTAGKNGGRPLDLSAPASAPSLRT